MSATWTIRPAKASEASLLPLIEKRAAAAFAPYGDATGMSEEQLAATRSGEEYAAACADGRVWVAEAGERLEGLALCEDAGDYVHLEELDVLPAAAGRGVGSDLVEEVCRQARRRGKAGVTLSTFRGIPWNAPFYRRRGFLEVRPEELSSDHVRIAEAERARGLRAELRVFLRRSFVPLRRTRECDGVRVEYLRDHASAIPTLARWHWNEWREVMPDWSREEAEDELRSHGGRAGVPTTLVAVAGNGVVGSVSLVEVDAPEWTDLTPWLASLFVAPEYRSRGVASMLVAACIDDARSSGASRLHLFTGGQARYYLERGWRYRETRQRAQARFAILEYDLTAQG